jgi:hypothetical protein
LKKRESAAPVAAVVPAEESAQPEHSIAVTRKIARLF